MSSNGKLSPALPRYESDPLSESLPHRSNSDNPDGIIRNGDDIIKLNQQTKTVVLISGGGKQRIEMP